MAGSFGFDKDKYDVSVAVGELELLPAVRNAAPETLIVANGFSCREQIAQCTDRHALHLAEIIQMALEHGVPLSELRKSDSTGLEDLFFSLTSGTSNSLEQAA